MTENALMLGNWLFDFSEWWLVAAALVLVLALPLTLVACWRRLSPRSPARVTLVMLLNVLAFVALFLLLTEPRREHMASQNVVLISEGIDLEKNPASSGNIVYIAPGGLPDLSDQQAMTNANWLLDMGQLNLREPALSSVELLGYGLSKAQWQSIPENVQINFVAPPLVGFSDMHWPHTLIMGQTMTIQGDFNGSDPDAIFELRLLDPAGQQINQQRIRAGEHFSLMVRPKSQGNILYRLQAWQKDTLLSDQAVTVSVGIATPLQIMVKQSAPSFETRQLKDFASTTGTEVLMYTRTSKGKSITQMVNQANASDTTFSPTSLAASDWLIIDGRALIDLPATQQQWLYEAVQSGLGVLVLADESLLTDFDKLSDNLLRGFSLSADNDGDDEVIPQLVNVSGFQNELPLPVFPAKLTANTDQAPLDMIVSDQNGRALIASQSIGLGKVAIGLISQSYRWVTAGHRISWSNYWSALSTALSRPKLNAMLIPPADNEFYSKNQRGQVCAFTSTQDVLVRISSNSGGVPQEAGNQESGNQESGNASRRNGESGNGQPVFELPLTIDSRGSARKCAWYWPTVSGWQNIQLLSPDSSEVLDSQSRYIWRNDQWPGQKRFERRNASNDRLAQSKQAAGESAPEKLVTEPLNTFWLWLLFITCASALWLERKLDWDAP